MPKDDLKPQASWVIGSARDCDLMVSKDTVSGHHCRLVLQGTEYTLEDLGSTNGTHVNGVRLSPGKPVRVVFGTPVTLGRQVEMLWPEAQAAPNPRANSGRSAPPPPARAASARNITIGRSPESDVQIDLPIVSWNHAAITFDNGKYFLEDLNSRNGTAIGELHNRIQRAQLNPSDEVYFGSYKVSASQLLSHETKVEIGEAAFNKIEFRGTTMEIGRDPNCDIPVQFPMVSWRHARVTRTAAGMYVEDLGSRNGTYVGGIRVSGKVLVKPGEEIGLGSIRFELLENGELAQRDYNGKVTIEARDIVVNAPNGKRLLNAVSLTVFPYELVALMGPAGAGKTTLLKALNGYTRPAQGTVLFRGQSLYDYYDLYRHMMGYVPQDDIVHPQLTVRQALYFSARLRTDLTDSEIDTRTEKVLTDLGIPDTVDKIIGSPERKTLSGGQRKRVNIALELITDTPVLFLDEPTSGLSSYDAESVVDLLKRLAKTGKAIITTIHQPSLKVYKQFDNLIMISRDMGNNPGAMVYFGPAYPDSIQFFNPPAPGAPPNPNPDLTPEMLFSGMNTVKANCTETWRQKFLRSHYQQEFVTNRSGRHAAVTDKTGEEKPRRQFGIGQWLALVKRNIIVKLQDRTQTAILLLQAPLFAVLVSLVTYPISANDFTGLMEKLPIVHFLMVVAAIWFGCNNAARDIVGEWTIYKRERMVTLKLLPYVFSKLAVLLALCIFQCGSMLAIVYLVLGLHSSFLYDFLVLVVASMIGAGMGLSISALARTNEAAIALLPVILLPIIALGGGMRPIYQMPKLGQILSRAIPSRWAFEATLLQEAKAKEWKPPTLPAPPPGAFATPIKVNPGSVTNLPGAPDPMEIPPTDFAQHHIPSYVLATTDRTGADLVRPALSTESNATLYRHRLRDSMAVLDGMFVLLTGMVILILRKRDHDAQ